MFNDPKIPGKAKKVLIIINLWPSHLNLSRAYLIKWRKIKLRRITDKIDIFMKTVVIYCDEYMPQLVKIYCNS